MKAGFIGLGKFIRYTWWLHLVFVVILFSGFRWITALGNPATIGQAKSRMYHAILGGILLLAAYLILQLINPELVSNRVSIPDVSESSVPDPDCQ